MKRALVVAVVAMFAFAALPSGYNSTNPVSHGNAPQKRVAPEDPWWKTISPTYTGWIHQGCEQYADPETVVSKGPITKIDVNHGDYIHGLRIWYGTEGVGVLHSYTEGIPSTEWRVPDGERITRVEGEIAGYYVSRLQFFTEGGRSSPSFGKKRGMPFVVMDPAKGALRTISGWANLSRHPSLNRAIASLTFQFGAPYFVRASTMTRPPSTPHG